MFRQILWMNDLSERAAACLDPIRALAVAGSTRVTLVYTTGRLGGRSGQPVPEALRVHAEEHLGELAEALAEEGIPTEVRVLPGRPVDVANRLVEERGFDLLVAGATGVSGLDRLLVGSTALRFLRQARIPVLVVGRRAFTTLHRVLCPLEPGDATPGPGLALAVELARATGATLTFLAVLPVGSTPADAEAAEAAMKATVEARTAEAAHPRWRFRATVDRNAAEGILHEARLHDLVVMSTHGRSGLERLVSGSVANSLVESCRVSVLVAR